MNTRIIVGDVRKMLLTLPDKSVQCCVTSPPYYCLRDYGNDNQIGAERSPQEYVDTMVSVFAEVWRVLADDGTLWLNLGDSYVSSATGTSNVGLPAKNLIGIPWRVAFALQSAGWYLRADIIWHKENPMPESVTDRPTKSHEYIFLLTKQERYYYDHEAIKEPAKYGDDLGLLRSAAIFTAASDPVHNPQHSNSILKRITDKQRGHSRRHAGFNDRWDAMERKEQCTGMRNKRDVWTVPTHPYPGAHFATYPPDLIRPCVRAGSRVGDTIIDPFSGAGTTGVVAIQEARNYIGIELNPAYAALSEARLADTQPTLMDAFEPMTDEAIGQMAMFD